MKKDRWMLGFLGSVAGMAGVLLMTAAPTAAMVPQEEGPDASCDTQQFDNTAPGRFQFAEVSVDEFCPNPAPSDYLQAVANAEALAGAMAACTESCPQGKTCIVATLNDKRTSDPNPHEAVAGGLKRCYTLATFTKKGTCGCETTP